MSVRDLQKCSTLPFFQKYSEMSWTSYLMKVLLVSKNYLWSVPRMRCLGEELTRGYQRFWRYSPKSLAFPNLHKLPFGKNALVFVVMQEIGEEYFTHGVEKSLHTVGELVRLESYYTEKEESDSLTSVLNPKTINQTVLYFSEFVAG